MSLPALRQPKRTNITKQKPKKSYNFDDVKYMIVTLKDDSKLVVTSDAYHGIMMAGETYECVFCSVQMELNAMRKEIHKNCPNHCKEMDTYPHIDDFGKNLIRKLQNNTFYCTICNVIVSAMYIPRHISSEVHAEEHRKAVARVAVYKPFG